jgi:hypothetical protein
MSATSLTWLLEPDAFPNGDCLGLAAHNAGHRIVNWSDEWWTNARWPVVEGPVLFHGSLENADRIARERPWIPGAYCHTENFRCSTWYRTAAKWLLHERWEIVPASRLVRDADLILKSIGVSDSVFVRPDSPLKPFSGRVLQRDQISLAALDHGFYYDDSDIDVVVAPLRQVGTEWRFVVVGKEVVAGSGYVADGRSATLEDARGRYWRFAAEIAEQLPPPDPAYVIDVCDSEFGPRLLELNPFSGADLYACNANEIVRRIAMIVASSV